jgi:molybdate transport system substrate-binding protein
MGLVLLVVVAVIAVVAAGVALPAALAQGQPESQTPTQAQLKVITSGGFAAALQEMQPEFEKATGIKLTVTRGASQGSGPDTIAAQLRRGVAADVVIMSREGLDDLIAEKKILAGSDINLGQTPLGMAVRAGASKPDISTVEAFKQTMLRAKSVTFPGSTTGIYMVKKLFPQLGIASEMAPKTTSTGVAAVAKGDAEIAVQPVSELLHAPGTEFVGTIPKEIQYVSVFSAAMVAGSKEAKAAKQLIDFLTSEKAKTAIKATGMEPVKAR